jgi:homoserine O-acetyltransferase
MTHRQGLGLVETRQVEVAHPPDRLVLQSGVAFGPVAVAYETYGTLAPDGGNAILVCHALSGDAHAAGLHRPDTTGWWDPMIGPRRPFDTDRFFVICSNVLGGCRGTTGPSSTDPATGRPYGLSFPIITVADMVAVQARLLDHLGVGRLLCVAGGSMGGMQALQWAASHPERVGSAVVIGATLKHSPMQIAFSEVGRQAVMADPDWRGGDYYGHRVPARGLAVARMIGHITYMSDRSMEEKFSRRTTGENFSFSFAEDFQVEGYLRYKGDSFVRRFDANSYLFITKAMDYFDLSADPLFTPGRTIGTRFLVIAFRSDWLYPPSQSREIVRRLKSLHTEAVYMEIPSEYGHDAFLVEYEAQSHLIRHFLEQAANGKGSRP